MHRLIFLFSLSVACQPEELVPAEKGDAGFVVVGDTGPRFSGDYRGLWAGDYSGGDYAGYFGDYLTPAGDPGSSDICALIEARSGHCAEYGYDCPSHTAEESWCFYDVLVGIDDPCFVFQDGPMCVAGQVTLYGAASCFIQDCFGITNRWVCYDNLAILCSNT